MTLKDNIVFSNGDPMTMEDVLYSMKRVANDQMTQGTYVSRSDLQVGDLVFFGYSGYANHVGMYIGGGNFVHASTPSTGVRVNSLDESYYKTRFLCGRRII